MPHFKKLIKITITLNKCYSKILNFLEHPESKTIKRFYNAYKLVTDFGVCCSICPYLNFVYEKTKDIDPEDYTTDDWKTVKTGSHNGESGGIKILLDVETFDFTFSNTDSHGFKIVFGNQRDKQIITQDGYLISTGKHKKFYFNC